MQITPAFEREPASMALFLVEGKGLARAVEAMPELLAPLLQFSSITAAQLEEVGAMEEEWQSMTDEPFPRVQWFDSSQGWEASQQILAALERELAVPDTIRQGTEFLNSVIEDLRGVAQNMRQAAKFGVRFHLSGNF